MVGGDVVVAWVDKENLKGYVEDYYLDAKSQCSGGRGSCPDEKIAVSQRVLLHFYGNLVCLLFLSSYVCRKEREASGF